MAIYNEILVGRFNKTAQKLFAIKGQPPLRQLGGELMPVIDLEKLPVELRYLAQWRLWAAAVNVVASVGNVDGMRLRNPLGSGVIGIIEKIVLGTGSTAGTFQVTKQFSAGDLATPFVAVPRDIRGGPPSTSNSALIPSFGNPAATSPGIIALFNMPINTQEDVILYEHQEIVLLPGDIFTLWENTVNVAANFTMWWRERPIEESETI